MRVHTGEGDGVGRERKAEQLELILNNLDQCIILFDDKGYIEYANKSFADIIGCSVEAVIESPFERFITKSNEAIIEESRSTFDEVRQSALPRIINCHIHRREQGSITHSVRFLSMKENAVPKYMALFSCDAPVVDRSADEKDEVLFILSDFDLVDCNSAAISVLGYTDKQQILKAGLNELIPEFYTNSVLNEEKNVALRGRIAEKGIQRLNCGLQTQSRGVIPVDALLVSLYPMTGKSLNLLICKDISERIEAIRNADLLQQSTDTVDKIRGEFVANMSHEIRTPLNAIIGMTELCLQTQMSQNQYDYIEVIQKYSKELLQVICDILDFSRLEEGGILLENENFNLETVLQSLYESSEKEIEEKGLEYFCEIDSDVTLNLRGDALRLNQVLSNLLSNAIKFTDSGAVSLIIDVLEQQQTDLTLQFCIKDTGVGVPSDQINKLFNSFFQADASSTRLFGGTGIGLAICKKIVKLMGGETWVESEEGVGSSFYFTAKLQAQKASKDRAHAAHAVAERKKIRPAKPIPKTHGEALKQFEQADLDRLGTSRILVAEDNRINVILLKHMLADVCAHVTFVSNGQECLDAVQAGEYDAVLMDIRMPLMDGYMATEKIRSMGHLNLPIIAITANSEHEERNLCFSVGMNDYISKPITIDNLLRTLILWVKGAKKTRPPFLPEKKPVSREKHTGKPCLLDEVRGLNVKQGLIQFDGNEQVYMNTLVLFGSQLSEYIGDIDRSIQLNQLGDADELLHSIKGVSGNLMVYRIFDAVNDLRECIDDKDEAQISLVWRRTRKKMDEYIQDIHVLNQQAFPSNPMESSKSFQSVLPKLEKLLSIIDTHGFADEQDIYCIHDALKLTEYEKDWLLIKKNIDEFSYEGLKSKTERLLNTLKAHD